MAIKSTLLIVAAVFSILNGASHAQSSTPDWQTAAGGKMEFDVASVKQNKTDEKPYSNFSLNSGYAYSTVSKDEALAPNGGYFSARNNSLLSYIIFAYKLSGTQELALRIEMGIGDLGGLGLFGGLSPNVPTWVHESAFDIEARAEGTPTKDQMRLMMQSLLAERFKLAVHRESKQVPIFALVLADPGKTGPNLQRHPASDSCDAASSTASGSAPNPTPQPPVCGIIAHIPPSAPGRYRFGGRNVTMALLANSLPVQTGMATISRPVVDQTGLSGNFDLSMEWTPEPTSPNSPADESGAAFRKALKDQLGLKLTPAKGPVDILVIDHVEMSSAN